MKKFWNVVWQVLSWVLFVVSVIVALNPYNVVSIFKDIYSWWWAPVAFAVWLIFGSPKVNKAAVFFDKWNKKLPSDPDYKKNSLQVAYEWLINFEHNKAFPVLLGFVAMLVFVQVGHTNVWSTLAASFRTDPLLMAQLILIIIVVPVTIFIIVRWAARLIQAKK